MAGTTDQLRCATGTASPALSYATLAMTASGRAPHRWCLAWGLRRLARLPRPVPEGLDRHRPAQRHQDRRHHRDAQDRRPGGGEIRSSVPHCAYFGPGNLASIHIVAALATDTPLENIYANLEANSFGDATLARDGKVRVPTGHGHGVEPDMAVIEKYRQGPVGCVR